jgi:AraC-like DNA-binding protein
MNISQGDFFNYPPINPTDEKWGIVCTTAGYQNVPPNSRYPLSNHPTNYSSILSGRILDEYQLLYIIKGEGVFTSASYKKTNISTGTMILLFPGEWHSYHPNEKTGWSELWVGFKGFNMDFRVQNGFFNPKNPIFKIGISQLIITQYEEIFNNIELQKVGFQQLVSGMILSILGNVYYKNQNNSFSNNPITEKINEACKMFQNPTEELSPQQIAESLNVSYSWFRRVFKDYTGLSPNQYILQVKLNRSKELLINSFLSISEIAFQLGFESISQFSNFFRQKEKISPSNFRRSNSFIHAGEKLNS